MKFSFILFHLAGALFFIAAAGQLAMLFSQAPPPVPGEGSGINAVYLGAFHDTSTLHFTSWAGLAALLISSAVSYRICRIKGYSISNTVMAAALAFFTNGLFLSFISMLIPGNRVAGVAFFLFVFLGLLFLLLPLKLHYLRFANPGGNR